MSRRSKSTSGGSTVDKEVANLFSIKDKTQYTRALLSLRQKYRDEDLVNRIQQVFMGKHRAIVKGAKKFAEAFRKRYGAADVPYHQLLAKARAHAKKHGISEDEFAEFQRMYEQELAGTNKANEVVIPVTNLMKVLGNINLDVEGGFNIEEADYRNLQDIIKEWEVSKPIHAQTLLQALQYTDLHITGLSGVIDRTEHNPGEHVHPVIAAMFLPKIHLFESHFLYSNIAGIVKSRHNQEPLTTRPDYELFYSMVTDPNDVVCDNRTPVGDLLNRSRLQQHLWNSVLHLRNGQVYNASFNEFIRSVDNCKLNKYDNPDFTYGRHDGTVIKRLMSAFSFRPTVVATMPVSQVFSTNPYAQNTRPCVTSIPMINVRLHAYQQTAQNIVAGQVVGGVNNGRVMGPPNPVALSSCLTQPQTFIEGNMLVQRISDVVYSREVLMFYVDRRAHLLQYGSPFNISRLPTAIAGFERINKFPIQIECSITVRANAPTPDTFCLRSVVIAEVDTNAQPQNNDPRSIVIGSSAFIFDYPEVAGVKGCRNPNPLNANWNSSPINKAELLKGMNVGILASPTLSILGGLNAAMREQIVDSVIRGFNVIGNNQSAADIIPIINVGAFNGVLNTPPLRQELALLIIKYISNSCDNATHIYHYDPANSLIKHAPYVVYDVLNNPLDNAVNPAPQPHGYIRGQATVVNGPNGKVGGISVVNAQNWPSVVNNPPGGNPGAALAPIAVNGLNKADSERVVREQGVIFIYQNFAYKASEEPNIAF